LRFFLLRNKQVLAGTLVTLLLAVVLNSLVAVASLRAAELKTADSIPEMEPVVVVGTVEGDATGKSTLDAGQISVLPTGNGNVGDLVKFMPGVQISDDSNTSFRAGEIAPPLLSISGGRPYQNNFQIDGMGNNSLIDPAEDNPHRFDRLPGHPEEIFLNSRLVKEITVYDNNVPARFGGFTGGVVDIETIDPAEEVGGSVHYRTTRDEWTEFHIDPSDQSAFIQSSTYFRQPEFTKHAGGFDLSLPVGNSSGLLFSYQFVYSEIPLVFFNTKKNQHRYIQNYLLKFVSEPTTTDKVTLQAIYSPYEGGYFIRDTMNGEFTLKGGGGSLLASYEKELGSGKLDLRIGFRRSESSRDAAKDFMSWTNSPSKSWGGLVGSGSSKEGGFGDIDILQDSYEFNVDWLSGVLKSGEVSHALNAGLQLLHTRGSYDRDEASYSYRTSVSIDPLLDPFADCASDTIACVPNEQYLRKRSVYGESHARARISQYALYLDDQVALGRLELRPGLRISYDSLMENIDAAPRLAGSYDLFGNDRSKLIGGWNRYYGGTLLTYKLRENIAFTEIQSRTTVVDNDSEWTRDSLTLASSQFSKLKTPYADEIVVGFDQSLWGGTAGFRYVRRDVEDEFAKERDPFVSGAVRYSRLNNNGKSHYESYRLAWERHWSTQFLSLNVSYDKATSTHGDYEDTLLVDDLDDLIWYDGALLYPDELPRDDYNRPWVANLLYTIEMPYGLKFANATHFRGGYRNIENSGTEKFVNGTFYDEYREIRRPSSTIFDWRINWSPPVIKDNVLILTLEIFNLFNKRSLVGDESDRYELGRQFWAGAEYKF
jgi:hypothetical protein